MQTIQTLVRAGLGRTAQACVLAWTLVLCPLSVSVSLAQAPDAGARDALEQRRALEREQQQRERLQAGFEVLAPTPEGEAPRPWPVQESPCFVIRRLILEADAAPSFDWVLEPLTQGADPAIGRCLGSEGLSVAAARAQRVLLERGLVTSRVLLAPQDVSGGTLRLTLLPGRIGAIRIAEGSGARAHLINALPMRVGDILKLRDIEQALENLRRVPTVETDIRIAPGAEPGLSELLIGWRQAFPLRLSLSLDDGGARSTGRYQGSATLSVDHWWTLNDLFYLSQGRDLGGGDPGPRGTRNTSLHYSLPLGHWALAVNASQHRYFQNVAGFSQHYRYSGRGAQQDITLSRTLQRDAGSKTRGLLKAFARQSSSFIDDTEVEVQRRRTGGWELGLEHRRQIGAAQLDLRGAFQRGTGAFGAMTAPEEAFDEGRSRFALFTLDAAWSMPLAWAGLHWNSQWRGQRERTPLTPQDRFAIGGRYSVRGFDGERSLAGERGWFWRNELSLPLGRSGQQLFLGLDQGRVGGASARWLVGQRLAGAVLGLRGGWAAVHYEVFIGAPLHKPDGFRTARRSAGFQLIAGF